jgi:DNA-binding CsgD family transcriptional regulator
MSIPLSAVEAALGVSLTDAHGRHARLTKREAQVAAWMAAGIPGGQIARGLGISAKTLEMHRFKLMGKLEAETAAAVANVVNLLRLADVADGSGD